MSDDRPLGPTPNGGSPAPRALTALFDIVATATEVVITVTGTHDDRSANSTITPEQSAADRLTHPGVE